MEFLEKLYEIENFGIYLFVVIGILIVLFLIVLFFGKKDSEKVVEVKEESKESEGKEAFVDQQKEEKAEVVSVMEEPVIPAPVEASVTFEKPKSTMVNQVLYEEEKEKPKEEVVQEKEFDFDALAEAISKELESIDKQPVEEVPVKPVIEEKEESLFTFVPEEKVENEIPVKVEEVKREEVPVKPRAVMPEVFSSVYVHREKETPKVEETPKEVPKVESPKMDLPKKIELPKRTQ